MLYSFFGKQKMDKWAEDLFEMIGRCRSGTGSRAAAALPEPREWFHDKNGVIVSKPLSAESKAGSVITKRVNKVKVIADFLSQGY